MAKDPKNKKNFFKNFKAELKKVIWPTPKQIVNGTTAVIVIVLIIAGIVAVLDLTFNFLNTAGLNRVREMVVNEEVINEEETNDLPDYPYYEEIDETYNEDIDIYEHY